MILSGSEENAGLSTDSLYLRIKIHHSRPQISNLALYVYLYWEMVLSEIFNGQVPAEWIPKYSAA
jgi:hypothetical protein